MAEQDNEGWIVWNGGICPVPDGTLVDVRLRDGEVREKQVAWHHPCDADKDASSWAGHAYWRHDGWDVDLVAYRLHQEGGAS